MADERVPAELRARIQATTSPVRPLESPWRRALSVLPLALVLIPIVLMVWGLREDHVDVGLGRLWGLTLLQIVTALLATALCLAESIPGRLPSRRALWLVAIGACLLVLGTTAATYAASPTVVPAPHWRLYTSICLTRPLILGAPALVLTLTLAARGLISRPVVVGGLAGLGAGLMSDASWRLFCHVSEPAHVLLAHVGAIAGLAVAGMLWGVVISRRVLR